MKTGRVSIKVRQQEQLILAMLQQPSLEKAAAAIGISKVTAWRISNTPEFQKGFRRARHESFSQATARLQHGSGAAASTLLKVMLDQQSPASSRVRAADLVLEHAAKGIEREDIEASVATQNRPCVATSKPAI